jgi:hypothetical protein
MKRHFTPPKISSKTEKKHIVDFNKFMLDRKFLSLFTRTVKIDHTHDIPYLGGYSKDGGTIYLDRHLPLEMRLGNKIVDITPFLVHHEAAEKSLMTAYNMDYSVAHKIASAVEHEIVRFHDVDVDEYEKEIRKYIKPIEHEKLIKVPIDLDIIPYEDSHDILAKKIKKRIKAEKIGK